ncbi:MAG: serine hydrolase [Candidatus Wallbacteria bacterium]|nr:serine hydrolase [Candidatus Wallbacteria bacterium]
MNKLVFFTLLLITINVYSAKTSKTQTLIHQFELLPGNLSVTLMKNGTDLVVSKNSDKPMAVASAFKLYILKALEAEVKAGTLSYDQKVCIENEKKSVSWGYLKQCPEGTQFSVRQLCDLMIGKSDNTATDHLLHLVGRENIEKYAPARMRPLLSTVEMFKIKYGIPKDLQAKYLSGNQEVKRQVLAEIAPISRKKIRFPNKPTLIDKVEWHCTTAELARLMYDLRNASAVYVNHGKVASKAWNKIGFKSGYEAGVVNNTFLLQKDQNGDIYTLSVTMNSEKKNVDLIRFNQLMKKFVSQFDQIVRENPVQKKVVKPLAAAQSKPITRQGTAVAKAPAQESALAKVPAASSRDNATFTIYQNSIPKKIQLRPSYNQ